MLARSSASHGYRAPGKTERSRLSKPRSFDPQSLFNAELENGSPQSSDLVDALTLATAAGPGLAAEGAGQANRLSRRGIAGVDRQLALQAALGARVCRLRLGDASGSCIRRSPASSELAVRIGTDERLAYSRPEVAYGIRGTFERPTLRLARARKPPARRRIVLGRRLVRRGFQGRVTRARPSEKYRLHRVIRRRASWEPSRSISSLRASRSFQASPRRRLSTSPLPVPASR